MQLKKILLLLPVVTSLILPAYASATPTLVVDVGTHEIIHADGADQPWYPASTTKLMTAYVAFLFLKVGHVTLDTKVVFSEHALSKESIGPRLVPGASMTLAEALTAMSSVSANNAAVAVAEAIAGNEADFVVMMNRVAWHLGMTGSHFENAEGLFHPGQVTTARDLAILAMAIDQQFPEYMNFFSYSEVVINGQSVRTGNDLLTRFSGTLGFKTGTLCASGRNLVSMAEREGKRLLAVVLGATTSRERSERSAALLQSAFDGNIVGSGHMIENLANNTQEAPEDMRAKVCGPNAAAYEREQNRLYPMGLSGNPSYLGDAAPPKSLTIVTRQTSQKLAVPLPMTRPSDL